MANWNAEQTSNVFSAVLICFWWCEGKAKLPIQINFAQWAPLNKVQLIVHGTALGFYWSITLPYIETVVLASYVQAISTPYLQLSCKSFAAIKRDYNSVCGDVPPISCAGFVSASDCASEIQFWMSLVRLFPTLIQWFAIHLRPSRTSQPPWKL